MSRERFVTSSITDAGVTSLFAQWTVATVDVFREWALPVTKSRGIAIYL